MNKMVEMQDAVEKAMKGAFREKLQNSVMLGGFTVYSILYETYVRAIEKAKTKQEKETLTSELIAKIRLEGIKANKFLDKETKHAN